MDRLGVRTSDFFVVLVGRQPQRATNQVHDVRSALFRVIEQLAGSAPGRGSCCAECFWRQGEFDWLVVGVEAQDERVVGDPLPAHVTVGDVLTVEIHGYRFAESGSGFQSSALISEPSGTNEANGARLDGDYPLGSRWTGRQWTSPW